MIHVGPALAFLFAVSLCDVLPTSAQVVIYENSAQYSGYLAQTANEYGDELMLAGSARILTKLQFQYQGTFISNFDERMRVRIYANDGPFYLGRSDYPTPGPVPLWESPLLFVSSGAHTEEVLIPSIKVPDRFTWTVQFYGVSMQTGITTIDPTVTSDVVGLMFYGLATTGQSYDDFWERLTGGWTAMISPVVPKNNFAVAVTAIPEVIIPRVKMDFKGRYVRASWPVALTNFVLQYHPLSSTTSVWYPTAPPGKIGDNWERIFDQRTMGSSIFRLKDISPARVSVAITVVEDGAVIRVRWPASATGMVLQSETAPGSGQWQDRPTPAVPTGDYFESVLQRKDPIEAFRLRDAYVSARLEMSREGGNLLIRWPLAARGQTLQSKPVSGGGGWSNVADAVITETSYGFEAVVPIGGSSKIFRLKQ